jgi:FAD-linked oxidoreductase
MIQKLPFWQNWAKNVSCSPSMIYYPKNEQEVVEIIQKAKAEGKRIRVVGNGHSFTNLAKTNQIMLSLSEMQGLIEVDKEKMEATAWAGTSINQLNRLLFEQGCNMENLGDIDVQSVAGATATGTHGTGTAFGNVSSQIQRFTIVTAAGEILNCSPTENTALFQAGRISLGALGIITRITLKVVEAYRLDYRSTKAKLEDTLDRIDEYNANNRNFEFYWFPYTKTVQLKMSNQTTEKVKDNATMRYINQHIMENTVFQGMCNIGKWIPASYALISKIAAVGVSKEHKINDSHKVYASPRNVRFKEMEYNVPREHFREIMERIVAKVNEQHYRVYFPVECRFVKGDDIWLSPAYERESAYIAVHVDNRTPHDPYFRDIEAIMMEFGGRPHWGKMHKRTAENLATAYPMWDAFQEIRAKMDPEGLFLNDYLKEVLVGVDQAVAKIDS